MVIIPFLIAGGVIFVGGVVAGYLVGNDTEEKELLEAEQTKETGSFLNIIIIVLVGFFIFKSMV